MIKLLYWAFVALDIGAILLFFTLGLAAAGSARTSTLAVVLMMLVLPLTPLVGSIILFVRSSSALWRTFAFVLAALPVVFAVSTQAYNNARIRANSSASGELMFFTSGPQRDLIEAIRRDDTSAVARALRGADVNAVGMDDMTPLVAAMRELRTATTSAAVLKLLLDAGADPNKGTAFEHPLAMALQVSDRVGLEPVALLLKAGANPALKTPSGVPIFFSGAGGRNSAEALRLLMEHGADLNATSQNGETILIYAATGRNWKAAHYLLTQGADWKQGRDFKGRTFTELVDEFESQRASGTAGASDPAVAAGFSDVITFLRSH